MMKFKHPAAFAMAIIISVATLSGCVGTAKESASPSAPATAAAPATTPTPPAATPTPAAPATPAPTPTPAAPTKAAVPELAPYTIKWFFPNSVQKNVQVVQDAINKITTEKINANVELNIIDWGSYDEKMKISAASGDEMDLIFTSNWTNDYISNVTKGAFQEITMDQLKKLGPNILEGVPANAWDAAKVKGKLYAIINTQVLARTPAILLQKKYIDKYKFDVSKVKDLKDFTPLFEQIAAGDPGIYPIDINAGTQVYNHYLNKMGYEMISETNPGGFKIGDDKLQTVNLFETAEMKEFLYLLRDWYKKGIIRKDASTVKDSSAEKASQKLASIFAVDNPDTLVNQSKQFGLKPEEMVMVRLDDPYMSTGSIIATMTAISRTSKNPERSIMLYNLLYDKVDTRVFNMVNYGVEGVNYTKVDAKTIAPVANSGYWLASGWETGNLFNCFKENPIQPDWYPTGPNINNTAEVSKLLGFSFDPTPVKSELAQCKSVYDEFVPALFTGSVDVDDYLGKFLTKLEGAGSKKIIAELQKQVDEWKVAK